MLLYLTGHGGEDFLKFQDNEEISAYELADAFEQMHQKKRYNELLFIIGENFSWENLGLWIKNWFEDTCQAESMIRSAYSPGFVGFASSMVGEDSLSHHVDMGLGVYMIDRFTFHLLEFLEKVSPNSQNRLADLKKVCPKSQCISTPGKNFRKTLKIENCRLRKRYFLVQVVTYESRSNFTSWEVLSNVDVLEHLKKKQKKKLKLKLERVYV